MHEATLVITEQELIWEKDKTHLAHDDQGRMYRAKRLPRPQIQGEVLRSILARGVGLGSPRVWVLVDERLEPVGIVTPVLELDGLVELKHPELLLAMSVKGALLDEDLLDSEKMLQNLALDPAGKLWVLDYSKSGAKWVSSWYEGDPNILVSLFALSVHSHFIPEQLPQVLKSWERAAHTGLDAFDGPGLRMLGDVRLLNQSLAKVTTEMLKAFTEQPDQALGTPRGLA
ncbi:hypothetical protein [Meiothermus hypogaeus]|uniref:Uncharacterized protein n=2 Tax=Meiothermus hypogaeus TaxID=884155 RepID=A0A511QYW7_9DEIN|nr:hypothetical protein [Meiothermus hypogaeus]RIH80341.1 hypothetical protein Mhypo_00645 [Meiothermus hypogaeus]GEM82563.1 hypothetical protein MHY01S_07290 [Meiothermus hypogaeus NBRC 106114]